MKKNNMWELSRHYALFENEARSTRIGNLIQTKVMQHVKLPTKSIVYMTVKRLLSRHVVQATLYHTGASTNIAS